MHPAVRRALEQVDESTGAFERHARLWSAAEVLIRVASAERIVTGLSSWSAPDARLVVLTRPSLGHWVGLFRAFGRDRAGRGGTASTRVRRPAMAAFLGTACEHGLVSPHQRRAAHRTVEDVFDALVTYRNRAVGHGAPRSTSFYSEIEPLLADALQPLAEETETESIPLAPLLLERDGTWWMLDKRSGRGADYIDMASGGTLRVADPVQLDVLLGPASERAAVEEHTPHVLPPEPDAFVARETEVAWILAALDHGGVVTLTGTPGVGKSRLAQYSAWAALGSHSGGVFHVPLHEADAPADACNAVARSLDIGLREDPTAQIGHALAARGPVLVWLDDAEGCRDALVTLLPRWTSIAPEARFLVTSRQRLGISGERAKSVEPLDADDARRLFDARIDTARARGGNTDALLALLDGNPLAIELAARRAAVIGAEGVAARMQRRWKVLSGGTGRFPSLRASLEASWEGLDDVERAALSQASVFAGPFTLEAAEQVLDLPDDAWAMDAIEQLAEKSLLRLVTAEEGRFQLGHSLAAFAGEQLNEMGEAAATAARHGAHFAAGGTVTAIEALTVHGSAHRRAARVQEVPDLVRACDRAIARGDHSVAEATALAAWAVLRDRDILRGRELLERVAPLAPQSARLRVALGWAGIHTGALAAAEGWFTEASERATPLSIEALDARSGHGCLARIRGDLGRAEACSREALERAVALEDRAREGTERGMLGVVVLSAGRPLEARALLEQATAVHREVGNDRGEALARGNLGITYLHTGEPQEARPHFQHALDIARAVGDRRHEGNSLGNLGIAMLELGDTDAALDFHQQALALQRHVGNRAGVGNALGNLGSVHAGRGDYGTAVLCWQEALLVHRGTGNRASEGNTLHNLGGALLHRGQLEEAADHLSRASCLFEDIGAKRDRGSTLGLLGRVAVAAGDLEAADARLAESMSLLREVGDRRELAEVHATRARTWSRLGDTDKALESWENSTKLRAELAIPEDSEIGRYCTEVGRELADAGLI